MKDAMEFGYKQEIHEKHPVLSWLSRHAGNILTRFRVGHDGGTAWELLRGKPYRRQLILFGEKVHLMPVKGPAGRANKLDPR